MDASTRTHDTAALAPAGRAGIARAQDAVVRVVIDTLVVLVLVVLVRKVVAVAVEVVTSFAHGSADAFKTLSVELLTVFVFIELFHSLTEYMRFRRIRVTHLVDASLAFVLREIWVGMYSGDGGWQKLLALAGLVLALGTVRTLAVVYSPSERAADAADA